MPRPFFMSSGSRTSAWPCFSMPPVCTQSTPAGPIRGQTQPSCGSETSASRWWTVLSAPPTVLRFIWARTSRLARARMVGRSSSCTLSKGAPSAVPSYSREIGLRSLSTPPCGTESLLAIPDATLPHSHSTARSPTGGRRRSGPTGWAIPTSTGRRSMCR